MIKMQEVIIHNSYSSSTIGTPTPMSRFAFTIPTGTCIRDTRLAALVLFHSSACSSSSGLLSSALLSWTELELPAGREKLINLDESGDKGLVKLVSSSCMEGWMKIEDTEELKSCSNLGSPDGEILGDSLGSIGDAGHSTSEGFSCAE